jgi:hypothetical protein
MAMDQPRLERAPQLSSCMQLVPVCIFPVNPYEVGVDTHVGGRQLDKSSHEIFFSAALVLLAFTSARMSDS